MNNETPVSSVSKPARIVGYILSYLPAALLLFGCVLAFIGGKDQEEGFADMGYQQSSAIPIAIALLVSLILYLVPRTSVLGAILLTGYFGGAVATHVRVQDGMYFIAIIFSVVMWLGLYLRDPRLRALIPVKKSG